MKALIEFDEKEFWIQLFSIVVRREERTEGEDNATNREACAGRTSPEAQCAIANSQ
jgi:hypothetical protein